jgi:hypothetical protein
LSDTSGLGGRAKAPSRANLKPLPGKPSQVYHSGLPVVSALRVGPVSALRVGPELRPVPGHEPKLEKSGPGPGLSIMPVMPVRPRTSWHGGPGMPVTGALWYY